MDIKNEFLNIMAETTEMALASSIENVPNVRILNFVYLENEKILFFQSKKGDQKEKEFEQNPVVAFTTIPNKGLAYVRVKNVIVKKSEKTIFDIKNLFIEKMPFYKAFIEQNSNTMDIYEIPLSKVMVFPDPDNFEQIEL